MVAQIRYKAACEADTHRISFRNIRNRWGNIRFNLASIHPYITFNRIDKTVQDQQASTRNDGHLLKRADHQLHNTLDEIGAENFLARVEQRLHWRAHMAEVNLNLLFIYILLLLDAGKILDDLMKFRKVFVQEAEELICDW